MAVATILQLVYTSLRCVVLGGTVWQPAKTWELKYAREQAWRSVDGTEVAELRKGIIAVLFIVLATVVWDINSMLNP